MSLMELDPCQPETEDRLPYDVEKLYQAFFEEAPVACFSVGLDARIRLANRRAVELLGYRLDELQSRSVFDLYADTPLGKPTARELFLQFRAGNEIEREEVEMCCIGGTALQARLSVRAIRGRDRKILASCSILDEITHGILSYEHRIPAQLAIKSAGRFYLLKVAEIDRIEAAGNYVQLHIGPKAHLLRETMNRLELKLNPEQFVRVHRSAIVNVERIKEIRPGHAGSYNIILGNGIQQALSRQYRRKLEVLLGKRSSLLGNRSCRLMAAKSVKDAL